MDRGNLIFRAKSGEQEAFVELYELHKRKVYSLCLRMTQDAAEAEDLTQEAFLQVFLKLRTFRGDSAFSTWLHRVVVNLVLMKLRSRRKYLQDTSLEEIAAPQQQDDSAVLGIEDRLLTESVDRLTLERAMDELPPGYRLIFVLHDILGYEHQDIAEILGCSVGNGKSQLHKARRKLRKVLSGSVVETDFTKAA